MELIDAARDTRWEIPVLLSATTGARRAEVLGIQWANVDLDRGRVRIVATMQDTPDGLALGPPKTPRAHRQIPVPKFAVERLRAHRREQAARRLALGPAWGGLDLVCEQGDGRPVSPGAYTKGFFRLAERAGFAGVRLHDLRHGVATALAKSGTPAGVTSKMLGHASVSFTIQTYDHPDEEMVDRAAQGLEEAFGA